MIGLTGRCSKLAVVAGLAASVFGGLAFAQSKYPERSIRMVVPFAPGGNTDIVARLYATRMVPLLGQQLIIDNRSGADGAIGSAEVARAKPDGYTLLVGAASTHSTNPVTMEKPGYDAIRDFAPISVIGTTPMAVAVHPTIAKTLQELIRNAKARPGQYSYGSAGLGGLNHLSGELFKIAAGGLDIVHIPYKGGGQSVQDLIAGQIPMAIVTLSSAISPHRNGRLRLLAILDDKRSKGAPDIPTAAEAGLRGVSAYTYSAVFAPAGTSKAIVDRLYQDTSKVSADPGFQKALADLTVEVVTDSNPGNMAEFLKSELAKWSGVVKALGGRSRVH